MPSPPQQQREGSSNGNEAARRHSTVRRVAPGRPSWRSHLESVITSYAGHRGISDQQLLVLKLYLEGKNDKEIAWACQCSTATVYEHWRRMAKKLGASLKHDVVADFHRFLSGV